MPVETPVYPVRSCAPISAILHRGAAALAGAGIDSPRREARLLLAAALGIDQAALLGERDRMVPVGGFEALLARRVAREPLALILGHAGFWSLDLLVSPATLLPRPDSETLIEAALAAFPVRDAVREVLDLGTGTGCLLLAALCEFPRARGIGVDCAEAAAVLAQENARWVGLAGRASFLVADWAAPLAGRFDLVLANPPYIETAAIPALMPEVARHEPARALDGGPDGLSAYRAILAGLPSVLRPGGVAVLELGQGQDRAVAAIAGAQGLAVATTRHDLSGVPRALVLRVGAPKQLLAKNRLAPGAQPASLHRARHGSPAGNRAAPMSSPRRRPAALPILATRDWRSRQGRCAEANVDGNRSTAGAVTLRMLVQPGREQESAATQNEQYETHAGPEPSRRQRWRRRGRGNPPS